MVGGGGWVCKPILVIGFARDKPQADQYKAILIYGSIFMELLFLFFLFKEEVRKWVGGALNYDFNHYFFI